MSDIDTSSLRFGTISDYDPKRHMARVTFPELDDLVSGWLPVIRSNTLNDKSECHLDIDEHVACILQGEGTEQGIILGSFYDDMNKPEVGEQDKHVSKFSDGTQIVYDRKEHKLSINCVGDIDVVTNQNIMISADGNVKISGSAIDIEADGNVKVTGARIDLN